MKLHLTAQRQHNIDDLLTILTNLSISASLFLKISSRHFALPFISLSPTPRATLNLLKLSFISLLSPTITLCLTNSLAICKSTKVTGSVGCFPNIFLMYTLSSAVVIQFNKDVDFSPFSFMNCCAVRYTGLVNRANILPLCFRSNNWFTVSYGSSVNINKPSCADMACRNVGISSVVLRSFSYSWNRAVCSTPYREWTAMSSARHWYKLNMSL